MRMMKKWEEHKEKKRLQEIREALKGQFRFIVEDLRHVIKITRYTGTAPEVVFPGLSQTGYHYVVAGGCFSGLEHVRSVFIPAAAKPEEGAFSGCTGLEQLTVSCEADFTYEPELFEDCGRLQAVSMEGESGRYFSVDGVLYEKDPCRLVCYPPGKKERVLEIPEGVRQILPEVSFPEGLEEIYFPESMEGISPGLLSRPVKLHVKGNPRIQSDEADPFSSFYALLPAQAEQEEKPVLYVEPGAVLLLEYAYRRKIPVHIRDGEREEYRPDGRPVCRILTEQIRGTAALEVTGATEPRELLAISSEYDGKKVVRIREGAFLGEKRLRRVILPETLREIGAHAFEDSGLETVEFPELLESVGEDAFADTPFLDKKDEEYVTAGKTLLRYRGSRRSVIIPESISEIGAHAFQGTIGLQEVVLGKQVCVVGREAFVRCRELTRITMENPDIFLGAGAFRDTPLEDGAAAPFYTFRGRLSSYVGTDERVAVPEGITGILPEAFDRKNASDLKQVLLCRSIRELKPGAFHACRLDTLVVPPEVEEIDARAFCLTRRDLTQVAGNETETLDNVGMFICSPGSACEKLAGRYGIPVMLFPPEELYHMIEEAQTWRGEAVPG